MPKAESHQKLAEKNSEVLKLLLAHVEKHPEWVTTVAFYRAVQIVEAMFANEQPPFHSGSHTDRLDRLKQDRKYEAIFRFFRPMYSASMIARYLEYQGTGGGSFDLFENYMSHEKVLNHIVGHLLKQLEASVERMTSP